MGAHQAPLHRKDMLLLLSLAASALAAPQMTYWNPYVVPHVYNQQPIVYAQHGVFGYPSHYAAGIPVATTRDLWRHYRWNRWNLCMHHRGRRDLLPEWPEGRPLRQQRRSHHQYQRLWPDCWQQVQALPRIGLRLYSGDRHQNRDC